MTEDDFKAAFRRLDRVEPSATFLGSVRSIPMRHPRESNTPLSLWSLLRLPSRLATLATAAMCGLGVGYLTLEQEPDPADAELSAFLNLDADDNLYAGSPDLDWDSP
jgi:hypothetical protein